MRRHHAERAGGTVRWIAAACLLGAALPDAAQAQETDTGAWFAYAAVGRLGEQSPDNRWRWWFDGHARFFEGSDGFETSIVRFGGGYDLGADATLWLGYAWIHNDPPSGAFDEQRFWQQLTWGRRYDWGTPFSRTRLEQRFDERGGDTGWRLRQFVRWTRPVSEGSRLAWRLWDEAFFDLNETSWGQDPGLAQNRAFAGLGWDLGSDGRHTLEFGYMNQYLWRDGVDDASNNILAITLLGNY